MPKKTIEMKTLPTNQKGSVIDMEGVPPHTPVTVTYDSPEVEIQPGQRWTKYGTTWTVQQNGEWWQIVTESHQVTLIRESDSFDAVACYARKELQTWLNENATIEEDGK